MLPGRKRALILALFADRKNIDLEQIGGHLRDEMLTRGERVVLRVVGSDKARVPEPQELANDIEQMAERGTVVLVAIRGPFVQDVLVAFDRSDRAVVFTDGSVSSVREIRRMLKVTVALGFGVDRVAVVLLDGRPDALDPAGLASALQRDILAVLPGPGAGRVVRHAAYRTLALDLLEGERPAPNAST